MTMDTRSKLLVATLLALLALPSGAQEKDTVAAELGVTPFAATYNVQFRGIRAGTLDFILRKSGANYVYESIAHPRGLAKMVVNNNLREASEFSLTDGAVRPVRYELDDGSKSTADDTRLILDWNSKTARGTHEDRPVDLVLEPGMQDRMSAQVVIMRWLNSGKPLEKITFIDRNELKEYSYKREREQKLKTPLGELDTVVVSSSRVGSNRVSRLWYAPSLGFVPVRGEQERKGKVETIFEIQKLEKS